MTGKKAEIDHKLAEALVVDKTKPLTAADGWLIGLKCCHRAKSAADIKIIRKSDRQRAKHIGAKQPSRFPGSRDSKFKKKLDGTVELRHAR